MRDASDDADARDATATTTTTTTTTVDETESSAFGGSDLLRAARATPCTPPPPTGSRQETTSTVASASTTWTSRRATFADLGASEKARLMTLIQKCVDGETERERLERLLETERGLRRDMEEERDAAVVLAKSRGEALAEAKERAAVLAATVARLQDRGGRPTNNGTTKLLMSSTSVSDSEDVEVPTPRGTLTLSPVRLGRLKSEYGAAFLDLVESLDGAKM
jgi:hypothetical protein